MKRKRLHTTLLSQLHRLISDLSEDTGIPVSKLLDKAVADFLENHGETLNLYLMTSKPKKNNISPTSNENEM